MRLQLLQVISTTDRRGAEMFAVDLRSALVELGRYADLVALAPGQTGGIAAPVLAKGRFKPRGLLGLHRLMTEADVVIGHGSSTLPACAAAKPRSGAAFVYRNIGDPDFWAGTAVRRARVRLFLSRVDGVAALWRGSADALVSRFGVPASRIEVIPNGRPAAKFPMVDEPSRHGARARLGLDGPVVVYLGSLTPEKRVDVAIRAVSRLNEGALVVAGEGPLRAALEQLAADEAPSRVRFLGSVSNPAAVLAAADVLVLTSDTEGLPGVLIEAGLSGVPAVSTDVGGASTVVLDGVTGLVVPQGDVSAVASALGSVLAGDRSMGLAAYARCRERFEMGPVARQWDDFLEAVGRNRRARRAE